MNSVLIGVFIYITVQLVVGVLVSRKIRSEADYLVAGRRLGLGLATFSVFATWFGAETCVGAAGKFYSEGLAGGATDPFGYTLALVLCGLLFAAPLWRRGLTTLADLFRVRFSPGVERFAALMMAPTSLFWAAAQIRAFGGVLHSASDLSIVACLTVATAFVIVYTCTGGLFADVVTDFIQGLAIIAGLLLLVGALALNPHVHMAEAWTNLTPARFDFFGGTEASGWATAELWAVMILGSVVAQEVIARILGTKSPEVARRSTLYGGAIYLAVGLIPAFLGMIGPQLLPGLADAEHFLPELARTQLHSVAYILFVGALISAILSTVDSTLLAASSLVSHNIIVSFRPQTSDRGRLLLARAGVVVFGIAAYALALGATSVFELVQQANGIGSAGIFVLMCVGLYTRGRGRAGAYATLGAGLGVWLYGTYVGEWACPYLLSFAAAVIAYPAAGFVAALWARRRRLQNSELVAVQESGPLRESR
jgi:Na+/proline symporter